MPAIQDSWTCCSEFGQVYEAKTGQKYSKADEQMYGKLCKAGDEEKAIHYYILQEMVLTELRSLTTSTAVCPGWLD